MSGAFAATLRRSGFRYILALVLAAAALAPSASAQSETPPEQGVWYEIFVRSFQDSDGDGVGDLRGIVERLDYLADLGVRGLWLTPIHPSPSYHGYDVTDYRAVNPDFGTLDDFDALIAAAATRGIDVILDLVVNHTSVEHPWFEASRLGDPAFRDWYVWETSPEPATGIGGGPAWHPAGEASYLGLFWSGMPDLNYRNEDVTREMKDIARFWLDRGAAGFRVDAIQHIVEADGRYANTQANLDWVADFNAFVRVSAPGAFMVGETWTQTPTIVRYHEVADLDMSFNFPLYDAIHEAVVGRNPGPIATIVEQDARLYPEGARTGTFLGNHDHVRAATALSPLLRDERRLILAAGLLLTLPGTPFLYYGEEIGMPNGPGSEDPAKRTPMRWDEGPGAGFTTATPWHPFSTDDAAVTVAAQADDPGSILSAYRALIALRNEHAALDRGDVEVLADLPSGVLGFVRGHEGARVAVFANLGGRDAEVDMGVLGGSTSAAIYGPAPTGGVLALGSLELAVLPLD